MLETWNAETDIAFFASRSHNRLTGFTSTTTSAIRRNHKMTGAIETQSSKQRILIWATFGSCMMADSFWSNAIVLAIICCDLTTEVNLLHVWFKFSLQVPCIYNAGVNQPCENRTPPFFPSIPDSISRNTLVETIDTAHVLIIFGYCTWTGDSDSFFASFEYRAAFEIGLAPKQVDATLTGELSIHFVRRMSVSFI